MAIDITFNGVEYSIPEFRDTNYANELTQFFVAIPNGSLQPTGGLFTLLAEVDFGASYGLKSIYYKSRTANPASVGQIRLAKTDSISFRDNANAADLSITKDTSDNLLWNTTKILLSGAVVNADINAAAAIAYSKLTLTNSILNADVNASAAIALSKLAAVTASRALVSDGSGFVSVSTVTATELGYVSGVTSALQTQLDAKLSLSGGTMTGSLGIGSAAAASAILTLASTTKGFLPPRMTTTQRDAISSPAEGLTIYNTSTGQMNLYASGVWTALTMSAGGTVNAGTQYMLGYYAANGTAISGLTAIIASKALVSDANGLPVASTVTATELGYVSGVTSAIQTQMDLKAPLASPTFTGTIGTPLTAARAMITGASGELAISGTTSTEIGYLSGVSSAIQTQLNLLAPKASPVFTGVVSIPLGAVGAPSIFFTGDSNTGIYSSGADSVNFAAGGNLPFQVTSDAVYNYFAIRSYNGTAAAPAYTFDSDPDCGMYRVTTNTLALAAGGTQAIRMDLGNLIISRDFLVNADASYQIGGSGSGFTRIFMNDGAVGTPSYSFSNDTNTGMYRVGADSVAIVTAGQATLTLTNGGRCTIAERFGFANGTEALPGLCFESDPDTGIYSAGGADNTLRFVAAGGQRMVVNSTDVVITGTVALNCNTILPNTTNTFSCGTAGQKWALVRGTTITSGDLRFENDWVIVEGDKIGLPNEGLVIVSPKGQRFKMPLVEIGAEDDGFKKQWAQHELDFFTKVDPRCDCDGPCIHDPEVVQQVFQVKKDKKN